MISYRNLVLADSPSLYWRLDATDAATDLSGNSRNGTAVGGLTYGTVAVNPALGYATDFDGTDDYITSGYPAYVNGTVRTFEGWIDFDSLPAGGTVLLTSSTVPSNSPALQFTSTGGVNWYPSVTAGGVSVISTPVFFTAGGWYHWAFVFDEPGDTAYFYVNGVLAQTTPVTSGYSGSPGNLWLGGYGLQFPDAKITNFAVYERGLTAAQIAAHNEAGRTQQGALWVRERPPLRLSIDAKTPSGQHYRWGMDETKPATVPNGLSFGSTMPGGFESMSCTLPRDPTVSYSDLDRLTTLTIRDAALKIVGQYRLEATPRVSGSQMSVSPNAVGWQAHLEDDKTVQEIYIDRDLSAWEGPTRTRREFYLSIGWDIYDASQTISETTGKPGITMSVAGPWATGTDCATSYDCGQMGVGQLYWTRTSDSTVATTQPSATFIFEAHSSNDGINGVTLSGDFHVAAEDGEVAGNLTPTSVTRYVLFAWRFAAANPNEAQYNSVLTDVIVIGRHGLAVRGTYPDYGYYASDVIADAVDRWAPALLIPTGAIDSSGFVIPQLAFKGATTVADLISTANRFTLFDWAVWEEGGSPAFYFHARGARGKTWRARVAPAELADHGPEVARLWNGVVVRYNDVDGTTRTVGPPGSYCNNTDAVLVDDDPENPATARGIKRWDLLDMGGISTLAGATEVGRRFLIEAKRLDSSGQARLVGYVEDDTGVLWPAHHVRAGDTISFVDAHDTSARRIIRADYSHDDRTTSIDLDAPPDSLAALLERLQVVLVPLGL